MARVMTEFKRYGIYYAPGAGALAEFGASWLGWDAETGQDVEHPEIGIARDEVARITATPRKYGLHGTIKPPFRLAEGSDEAGLRAALGAYCATRAPLALAGLGVATLGSFLALRCEGDQGALAALAFDTVRHFESFRAPLNEAELTRRCQADLTPRQEELLKAWGYPYVDDAFRFHVTLSGRLTQEEIAETEPHLKAALTPLLPRPFVLRELCLFGEDMQGRFHLIERFPLMGSSA